MIILLMITRQSTFLDGRMLWVGWTVDLWCLLNNLCEMFSKRLAMLSRTDVVR